MLVGKDIAFDARVHRSARSLAENGYEVRVLCCAPDQRAVCEDHPHGYRVVQVPIVTLKDEGRALRQARRDARESAARLIGALEGREPSVAERDRLRGLKAAVRASNQRLEEL